MPMSNYTNFLEGVTIRNKPIVQLFPGKILFVNNSAVVPDGGIGGSDNNRGTYLKPLATIDAAIGKCVAGRGDIICVMPGHAETISNATTILLDVSGVAIVGLGSGALRPTLTFDTAITATIPVSAANCCIHNLILTANFADITAALSLTTAKDFVLSECYIKETAVNMNFLNVIDTDATTANSDGLTVHKCVWIEPDLATLSFINMDGTNDRVTITENYVNLGVNNNKAALLTIANGKLVTSLDMSDNKVYRLNTDTATGAILLHTNGSTNTGIVYRNMAQHADVAAELLITATAGLGVFNNYASGVAGASGYLLPAADS